MNRIVNCPLCTSEIIKPVSLIGSGIPVFRCKSCGLEFLHPQPTMQELDHMYSASYYKAWGIEESAENEVIRKMKKDTFRLRFNLIRKYAERGKILDVGCATGYFLELAQEFGFEPYGVELSGYASAIVKEKFGQERIFNGTLEQCKFPDHFFDVIGMSDLIEHVSSPSAVLHKASALLKPGGILMIVTPDTESFSKRWMGKRWLHYKPEHLFYFNRKVLKELARKSGLHPVYFAKAKKALNIDYMTTQFAVYRHGLFTPATKVMRRLLPSALRAKNFHFAIGEMLAVFKKPDA